jgi:hypothetical protein
LIDSDEQRYSVSLLSRWKHDIEQEAHRGVGRAKSRHRSSQKAEQQIKRNLRVRDDMRRDFLKGPKEYDEPPGLNCRPYERFRDREVIVHRLENDCYPEIDYAPGISSWFKIEPFDFYYGGIKVVLGISTGVTSKGELCSLEQELGDRSF